MAQQAVFLDKDGTLVPDVPYNVDPARIELEVGAAVALSLLARRGYRLVVVSNQSGVAHGMFPESALRGVERRLRELLDQAGVPLAGFYYCPHFPGACVPRYAVECECRKPRAGLLRQAADELDLDLPRSWMVGDILDDVQAGHLAGCRSVLVLNGGETQWNMSEIRLPDALACDLMGAADHILQAPAGGLPSWCTAGEHVHA